MFKRVDFDVSQWASVGSMLNEGDEFTIAGCYRPRTLFEWLFRKPRQLMKFHASKKWSAIVLSLLWLTLNVVISSTANAATNNSVDFLLITSRNSEYFSSSKSAIYSPAQPIITNDIAQYSITSQKESADNIAAMITDIRKIRRHAKTQNVFLLLNGIPLIALIILRLYKLKKPSSTKHLSEGDIEQ